MVKWDDYGTPTLTPFRLKATFTSTSTPLAISGVELASVPSSSVTSEPTLTEEASQDLTTETASSTLSSSPTSEWNLPTSSLAPAPTKPSATVNPTKAPATVSPPKPSATESPTKTIATPNPPPASSTPQLPTATSEPAATPAPTATPVLVGCNFSGNASYENQVVELINQERNERGLSPLTQNSSLNQAARRHSEDMACNDFFSHTGSDGSTMSSRILAAGYSFTWAAENIAASSNMNFSAQAVVSMWMNSTGHRNNILSENAKHIGVGFRYVGDTDPRDLDAYYTADFGRP